MKNPAKNTVRWWVRGSLLLLSAGLVVGGPFIPWLAKVIPALSPLTAISASLAHRAWYATLFWTLPAVLALGLALWKGRLFCRCICPLGTLYAAGSIKSLKKKILPVRLNGFLFWLIIFASVVGLPLLLFLDPLSTFTRVGAMSNFAHWASWVPGLLIPVMLLLGLFQPLIWCTHLCPLGYLFETVKIRKLTPQKLNQTRREMIVGGLLGIPLALLLKNKARAVNAPVLPPGATDLDNFSATCKRCYACVHVCPTKVITVRKSADGLAELCLPELNYDQNEDSYCEEFCNACSQACPTGAIRPLTEEAKRMRKIGTARVIRDACLGWHEKQECMACDEFCPYNAIEAHYGKGHGRGARVPKPVVNPHKCRGCGACQAICPAIRMGKAIVVDPMGKQGKVDNAYT
ncbi:4Fe-4S dicluster domain-containing protein [Verrucomicrobiota bacterium]